MRILVQNHTDSRAIYYLNSYSLTLYQEYKLIELYTHSRTHLV